MHPICISICVLNDRWKNRKKNRIKKIEIKFNVNQIFFFTGHISHIHYMRKAKNNNIEIVIRDVFALLEEFEERERWNALKMTIKKKMKQYFPMVIANHPLKNNGFLLNPVESG